MEQRPAREPAAYAAIKTITRPRLRDLMTLSRQGRSRRIRPLYVFVVSPGWGLWYGPDLSDTAPSSRPAPAR
jgi:hypothetical protein